MFSLIGLEIQNKQCPIHVAAGSGHVDIVNYLHMKGADLQAKDDQGLVLINPNFNQISLFL